MASSNKSVKSITYTVRFPGDEATFTVESTRVVGNDDAVYSTDREVWKNVPRGSSRILVDGKPVASIQGMRKFGYWDDPYGDRAAVVTAIGSAKVNGENLQVAAFRWPEDAALTVPPMRHFAGGDDDSESDIPEAYKIVYDEHTYPPEPVPAQRYWIVGSKNVPVVFRSEEDLNHPVYEDPRFTYALRNARLFIQTVLHSRAVDSDAFWEWLEKEQLTAVGEAILSSSQHIVDYDEDQIQFFALTRASMDSLAVFNPHTAQINFKHYGLRTPDWVSAAVVIGSDAHRTVISDIREQSGTEGAVFYGMDSTGNICFMWKEKSVIYVLERAAREAILSGANRDRLANRLALRAQELVSDGFTRPGVVDAWMARRAGLLERFRCWLHSEGKMPRESSDSRWDVQSRWLTLQREFSSVADTYVCSAREGPCVIMMQGLPGSGKSTLARSMFVALKKRGMNPRWLNQDESVGANKRRAYLSALETAMKDSTVSHIILDKSNLDAGNRADYSGMGITANVAVVLAGEMNTCKDQLLNTCKDQLLNTCKDRILARGTKHRSLRSDGPLDDVLAKMQAIASDISEDDADKILRLDVHDGRETQLTRLWETLFPTAGLTADECAYALTVAKDYENLIGDHRTMYWAVGIDSESRDRLIAAAEGLTTKKFIKDMHCTLKFMGDFMDPEAEVYYSRLKGQAVQLRCVGFAMDDKALAAQVEVDILCSNTNPHITMAVGSGIKPVYSNEMLAGGKADFRKCDLPLTGTIKAF